MIWGLISRNGMGSLVKLEGSLNSERHTEVLAENFLSFVEKKLPQTWIFQQDNAKCHTAKSTMDFFQKHKIKLLE